MQQQTQAAQAQAVITERTSLGRAYFIKVYKPDGSLIGFAQKFESGFEASQAGMEHGGIGSRVVVRPLVEQTYMEGVARYPDPLHPQATQRAREGWDAESSKAERAVLAQMQVPGYGRPWGAA